MKKHLLLLLITLFIGGGISNGFAQEDYEFVQVGNSTSASHQGCPTAGWYGWQFAASVYTLDELGSDIENAGSIMGLAWHFGSSTQTGGTVKIYIQEIEDEEISTSSVWATLRDQGTLVYDGDNIVTGIEEWAYFEFDDAYDYSGGNILVMVESQGCTVTGSCLKKAYYPSTTYPTQSFIIHRDSYALDPSLTISSLCSSSGSDNYFYYKPDIRFYYTSGGSGIACHSVKNLAVGNVTVEETEISWTEPEDGGSYIVQYKTASQSWDDDEVVTDYTSSTSYTLYDLSAQTTYNVRVINDCGSSQSSAKIISFTTPCGTITSFPFEQMCETQDPCWQIENVGSYSDGWTYASSYSQDGYYSMEGSGMIRIAFSEGIKSWFISPVLDLTDLSSPALTFGFITTPYSNVIDTLGVYYRTSTSDDWTYLWSYNDNAGTNGWASQLLALPNPSSTYQIAFLGDSYSNYGWGVGLDSIVVLDADNICLAPTSFSASDLTANSATISWIGNDDATFNIEYKTASASEWEELETETSDSEYSLSDLNPNTTYNVRISQNCSNGSTSGYLVGTFTTLCGVYEAPFLEEFNSLSPCWNRYVGLASDIFDGESLENDANNYWYVNSSDYGMTNSHAHINNYGEARKHWLVSPQIDLSNLSNPGVMFDLQLTQYNSTNAVTAGNQSDDQFMVIISTDGGETWSEENAIIWNNTEDGDYVYDEISATGQEISISLADYAGQTVRIALYAESTVSNGDNDLHIDNFKVDEFLSCLKPSDLSFSNIGTSSATVSWTPNGEATEWTFEYKESTSTEWIETTVYETSVELTDLESTTNYDVRVSSNCSDENSEWVNGSFSTTAVPTELPYSTDFESADWVINNGTCPNYWTIGTPTGENQNALFITNDGTTAGYNINGSNSVVIAEKLFALPSTDSVHVSFDVKVGGENSYDYLKVFLAPANVEFQSSTSNTTQSGYDYSVNALDLYAYNGNYHYALSLTNGTAVSVDMNVANPYNGAGNAKLVFLWRNDGSVGSQPGAVIYNVAVDASSCPKPSNLAVSEVGITSASVSWTGADETSAWTLRYKAASESEWTEIPAYETSVELTDLDETTTYSVQVRTECDEESSNWVSASFTTAACEAADQCTYTLHLHGDLHDSWQSNAFINIYQGDHLVGSYTLEDGPTEGDFLVALCDETETSITFTSNGGQYYPGEFEVTLYNMVNDVIYYIDGLGDVTPGSTLSTFESSCSGCMAPANLTVTNVSENSASFSWEGPTDGSYTAEYKLVSETEWNVAATGLSTTTYELTNLEGTSSYQFRVKNVCDDDEESSDAVVTFSTTSTPVAIPYSTDFEYADWTLNNGNCTNYWTIGTPTGETESALFITNNGTEAQYSVNNVTTVVAEKLFTLPSTDSIHVEFDVKIGGELGSNPWDFMKAFLSPASVQYEAASNSTTQSSYQYSTYALNFSDYAAQVGSFAYPYCITLTNDNIVSVSMNVANPAPGANGKFAFLWYNDASSGSNPGAIVYNFSISEPGDAPVVVEPTVVTNNATAIAQTTATLNGAITNLGNQTITARGFEWKATNGGTYTQVSATGTTMTYNLTGLTANTSYTYRAFATTANTTTYGSEVTFTTLPEDVEPCNTPTNVAATNVTNNSMTITWDANGANKWTLQYRTEGGSWNTTNNITETSYTINDLQEATVYQIQVKAVCDNQESEWSTMISQGTGLNDLIINSISLYPNPANSYVDVLVSDNDLIVSRLEVYDVYGKLLNQVEVIDNPTRINVSSLANGMYFVKVVTENGVATKSFIKK